LSFFPAIKKGISNNSPHEFTKTIIGIGFEVPRYVFSQEKKSDRFLQGVH